MMQCLMTLSSHKGAITCIRWGGSGLIYSGSRDRSLRVWRDSDVSLLLDVNVE